MKFCTRIFIRATHVADGVLVIDKADLLDVGLVDDDHKFGADDGDVRIMHIEGSRSRGWH